MNKYTHERCGGIVEMETQTEGVIRCGKCGATGSPNIREDGDDFEVSFAQVDTTEMTEADIRQMMEEPNKPRL